MMYNTQRKRKQGKQMQIELLEIDFNSEEAIYVQPRNQIILGIATSRLQDGDTLVSKTDGRMYRN